MGKFKNLLEKIIEKFKKRTIEEKNDQQVIENKVVNHFEVEEAKKTLNKTEKITKNKIVKLNKKIDDLKLSKEVVTSDVSRKTIEENLLQATAERNKLEKKLDIPYDIKLEKTIARKAIRRVNKKIKTESDLTDEEIKKAVTQKKIDRKRAVLARQIGELNGKALDIKHDIEKVDNDELKITLQNEMIKIYMLQDKKMNLYNSENLLNVTLIGKAKRKKYNKIKNSYADEKAKIKDYQNKAIAKENEFYLDN